MSRIRCVKINLYGHVCTLAIGLWMVPGAEHDRQNSGKLAKRSELLHYRGDYCKYCDHGTLQVATIG